MERVNGVLAALLMGTRCPESPLYLLRGGLSKILLRMIWGYVKVAYKKSIRVEGQSGHRKEIYAEHVYTVPKWPEFKGRSVNMMPFVIGDHLSLPEELQDYWPLIHKCGINAEEQGKVGYLTVDESVIKEEGASQRRPGLHTESPGFMKDAKGVQYMAQRGVWGGGYKSNVRYGGIYLGSNVSNSTQLFKASIVDPSVIGPHGDIGHLESFLLERCGHRPIAKEGQIWWLTDTTPHESLPLQKGTRRQFFRVVTSQITVWFADHSTSNPKVKIPAEVKVIRGNKFKA